MSIVLQHPQEVSTAVFLLDLADVQCATLRIKRGPVLKFSIEVLSRLTRFPLYNLLVSSIKPGEWSVVLRQIGDLQTHIVTGGCIFWIACQWKSEWVRPILEKAELPSSPKPGLVEQGRRERFLLGGREYDLYQRTWPLIRNSVKVRAWESSLVAQMAKHLLAMRETWVQTLGCEDILEKEMATHSSTLAWKIPRTEEPGRLQSMGLQRVGHDWVISLPL